MNKLIFWISVFVLCLNVVFAAAPAGTATHTKLYCDELYGATGNDVVVGGALGTYTRPSSFFNSATSQLLHIVGAQDAGIRMAGTAPLGMLFDFGTAGQTYIGSGFGGLDIGLFGPSLGVSGGPEVYIDPVGDVHLAAYTGGLNKVYAANICDENGMNCKDISQGWMAGAVASSVTLTSTLYNGVLSYPSINPALFGYAAANAICNAAVGGSHLCTTDDVLSVIAVSGASAFSGLTNGWIAEGPPGDVAPANDCVGWTSSSSSQLGPYWAYSTSSGGAGWLTNCAQSKPLSCCK